MSDFRSRRAQRVIATGVLALCSIGWSSSIAAAADPATSATTPGYYEDALRYERQGDLKAAMIQLRNAIKLNPGHLPSRFLLGQLYLRTGDPKSAVRELRLARERGADDDLVLVPLGTAYLAMSRFKVLLDEITTGGHAPRVERRIRLLRGQAHLALHALDAAENDFVQAQQLAPQEAAPLVGRARVELARGNTPAAEKLLDRGLSLEPEDADAWYEKGLIRRRERRLDKALSAFQRALESDPRNLRARVARASVLIEVGRFDDADRDLKFVREKNPVDAEAIYLQALLKSRQGDRAGAKAVLKAARGLIGAVDSATLEAHPTLLLLAGLTDYSGGQLDKAYKELSQFLRKTPRHPGASKIVGAIRLERGNVAGAIKILEPVALGSEPDPIAYTMLGDAYMEARRYRDATRMFERAAKLTAKPDAALTRLALSRARDGDAARAVQDLESALAIVPGSVPASVVLVQLHLRRREFTAALKVARDISARHPDNPMFYNLIGAAAIGQRDFATARSSYKQALVVDPDYLPAQINLGKLDAARGDTDAALRRFKAILKSRPNEIRTMREVARVLAARDRIVEAIALMEKASAIDSAGLEPQLDLVALYLRHGDLKKALATARALEAKAPEDLRVLLALGRALYASGQREPALTRYRRLAKLAGFDARWLYRVAKEQSMAGDLAGAAWSLRKAVQGDENYRPARRALVAETAKQGRLEDALAGARQYRERWPKDPLGALLTGDVEMQAQRYEQALTAYREAFRLTPAGRTAIRIYQARTAAGDARAARTELAAWVRTHPAGTNARRVLASAYLQAGSFSEAITHYQRLLKDAPADAALLNDLAWLYARIGDRRAQETAAQAYALAPERPDVLDTYGWILVKAGERTRGLGLLREAHSRAANNPALRYHLGATLHLLGRDKEARPELEAALSGGGDFREAPEARALLEQLRGS